MDLLCISSSILIIIYLKVFVLSRNTYKDESVQYLMLLPLNITFHLFNLLPRAQHYHFHSVLINVPSGGLITNFPSASLIPMQLTPVLRHAIISCKVLSLNSAGRISYPTDSR